MTDIDQKVDELKENLDEANRRGASLTEITRLEIELKDARMEQHARTQEKVLRETLRYHD